MAEFLVTFAAGASYGLTTVIVGQPLDTIKVRMQGMPSAMQQSALTVGKDLFLQQGVRGLYRGGLPLFLGGSFMRSAQFGVSGKVKHWLDDHPNLPHFKVFGLLDWQVIVAGIAGGLGRGLVEIPTDFLKTRRQVERSWTMSHLMDGTAITLVRNTVLYASFMVYIDLTKQACQAGYVTTMLMNEEQNNLKPFLKGAICANLAWLTVWPADVVKTQRQSGNYDDKKGLLRMFQENFRNGQHIDSAIWSGEEGYGMIVLQP
ncbi:mitochondrial carrier protein [Nitzschia inconspicua]|uniref:Mitochondrial carrier protein n=1 Tax=Nitzschia inconspicua TaxID=303405 RepID=A0A9K3LMV9_9STRA|nr:mitochondrial carrier protein [Nitzschia inconspicua]